MACVSAGCLHKDITVQGNLKAVVIIVVFVGFFTVVAHDVCPLVTKHLPVKSYQSSAVSSRLHTYQYGTAR